MEDKAAKLRNPADERVIDACVELLRDGHYRRSSMAIGTAETVSLPRTMAETSIAGPASSIPAASRLPVFTDYQPQNPIRFSPRRLSRSALSYPSSGGSVPRALAGSIGQTRQPRQSREGCP